MSTSKQETGAGAPPEKFNARPPPGGMVARYAGGVILSLRTGWIDVAEARELRAWLDQIIPSSANKTP